MASSVVWHGSEAESYELLQALSRNCTCVMTAEGVRLSTCAGHAMLIEDQRAIDGLVCSRRRRAQLIEQEMTDA